MALTIYYAWKDGSDIYYTLSDTPSVGDNVYSDTAETIYGTVKSYPTFSGGISIDAGLAFYIKADRYSTGDVVLTPTNIADAIEYAQFRVANAYTAVSDKGGALPQTQNLTNLPTAINSITPTISSLNITPRTYEQTFDSSSVDGYKPVVISAVTSSIDSNITSENIKDGVAILGVTGNYTGGSSPVISSLSITPTTSQQTITAPSGTDGYSPITVSAVTSSIDSNISAGNIKSGVTILGVTGSYSGTTPSGTLSITANGVYDVTNYASANVSVSGGSSSVTPLNYQILYDSSVTSEEIIAPAFANKILEKDFFRYIDIENSIFFTPHQTSITRASSLVMNRNGKPQLKEVHLDALETITGSKVFQTSFQDCTNLISLTFSNLVTASAGSCFGQMCKNDTNLMTVSFDKLSTLSGSSAFGGTNAIGGAFNGCTSLATLSFPSLTSTSFGSYTNQFNMMLKGVTGCTVHFPSNLQSVIGSWSSVTSGFGGTNTIVLFDLPVTS